MAVFLGLVEGVTAAAAAVLEDMIAPEGNFVQ